MVVLNDREITVLPAVDGAVAVAVLIDKANVLKDVPLLVVGFEDGFVLIHLTQPSAHRVSRQITTTSLELMAPQRGFHHATAFKPGLAGKEFVGMLVLLVRPPAEAVAALTHLGVCERLHFQVHVQVENLVVTEGVLPPGTPQPQIAAEPAAQVAIHLNRRLGSHSAGNGQRNTVLRRKKRHGPRQ